MTPGPPPDGEPVPADAALPPAALAGLGQRPFGVYVHVPFCATRCGYCDFNTYTAAELGPGVTRDAYAAQAIGEIRMARRVLGGAAAQGEDRLGAVDQVGHDPVLDLAERGLAVLGEDVPHRPLGPLLDDQVAVDERQPEALGQQVPDGGLAGPHEADEDDHLATSS